MFLTVLLLLGALYPSAQAYANRLPFRLISAEEKEILVNNLANDKIFAQYIATTFIINLKHISSLSSLEKQDRLMGLEQMQDLSTSNNEIELNKLTHKLGYKDFNEFKKVNDIVFNLFNQLSESNPLIKKLDESQIQEIFKLATLNNTFKKKISNLKISDNKWYPCFLTLANCFGSVAISFGAYSTWVAIGCATTIMTNPYISPPTGTTLLGGNVAEKITFGAQVVVCIGAELKRISEAYYVTFNNGGFICTSVFAGCMNGITVTETVDLLKYLFENRNNSSMPNEL